MRLKILFVIFLILLSFNALASGPLYVHNYECEKDGSLKLIFDSYSSNKIYTGSMSVKSEYIGNLVVRKSKIDLEGVWSKEYIKQGESERIFFKSEEALMKLKGKHLISVGYSHDDVSYIATQEIDCPGFEFSCKLIGVYLDFCRNIDGRFEAGARIYGLGDITKENLSLEKNTNIALNAEATYEDIDGAILKRGGLPKGVVIENPEYGVYLFNVSNFDNIVNNMVLKIQGINYIAGGCASYPNISLYSYKECETVEEIVELKEVKKVTSNVVKEPPVDLEKNIGTQKVEDKAKWHLIVLFLILSLCVIGTMYIIFKRNFNKEPSL